MTEPGTTLKGIRQELGRKKFFRVSDFLDESEQRKLAEANSTVRKKPLRFDKVDALVEEIISRFGYDVYDRWNRGEISTEQLGRWLAAARAREKASLINLEGIIMAMVSSCVRRSKKGPKPKGLSIANKIYKRENEIARGEF